MTVLVWLDPGQTDQVLMSLHIIPAGSWQIDKMEPQVIDETSVKGHHAIWTSGPYPLRMRSGDFEYTRLIQGHVLIWTDGITTYRLETNQSMEEAVRIAESLQPSP